MYQLKSSIIVTLEKTVSDFNNQVANKYDINRDELRAEFEETISRFNVVIKPVTITTENCKKCEYYGCEMKIASARSKYCVVHKGSRNENPKKCKKDDCEALVTNLKYLYCEDHRRVNKKPPSANEPRLCMRKDENGNVCGKPVASSRSKLCDDHKAKKQPKTKVDKMRDAIKKGQRLNSNAEVPAKRTAPSRVIDAIAEHVENNEKKENEGLDVENKKYVEDKQVKIKFTVEDIEQNLEDHQKLVNDRKYMSPSELAKSLTDELGSADEVDNATLRRLVNLGVHGKIYEIAHSIVLKMGENIDTEPELNGSLENNYQNLPLSELTKSAPFDRQTFEQLLSTKTHLEKKYISFFRVFFNAIQAAKKNKN